MSNGELSVFEHANKVLMCASVPPATQNVLEVLFSRSLFDALLAHKERG